MIDLWMIANLEIVIYVPTTASKTLLPEEMAEEGACVYPRDLVTFLVFFCLFCCFVGMRSLSHLSKFKIK